MRRRRRVEARLCRNVCGEVLVLLAVDRSKAAAIYWSVGIHARRGRALALTTRGMTSLCSPTGQHAAAALSPAVAPARAGRGWAATEQRKSNGRRRSGDRRAHCYRLLGGGGCGFGVPVVSYAPRPMLLDSDSLSIIVSLGVEWAAI